MKYQSGVVSNELNNIVVYLVDFSLNLKGKIDLLIENKEVFSLLNNLQIYYKKYMSILDFSQSETSFSLAISELLTFSFLSFYLLVPNKTFDDVILNYSISTDLLFFDVFCEHSKEEIKSFFFHLDFNNFFIFLKSNHVIEMSLNHIDVYKDIYEKFLERFNKKLLKKSGVYYSPYESVKFISNSIQKLIFLDSLQEKLSSNNVNFIDPACGTGQFLLETLNMLINEQEKSALKNKNIHIIGFDVNPVSFFLTLQNFRLWANKNAFNDSSIDFSINNISPIADIQENIDLVNFRNVFTGIQALKQIRDSKNEYQIIIGNPPYSAISNNSNLWINNLLKGTVDSEKETTHNYFEVNGIPIKEKKSGWLYDDYVKFIRFGHWIINRAEKGILSYICNSGFLSNPSFRGMRYQLLQTFDEFYILDLHGNKKTDNPPNNIIDENIFNIIQDICVFIFIKNPIYSRSKKKFCYFDLWGSKKEKLSFLQNNDYSTITWKEFKPQEPFYIFIPEDSTIKKQYMKFWSIKDIFKISGTGLITSKDSLTLQFSKKEMLDVLKDFSTLEPEKARAKYNLGPDTENWKVITAQKDILDHGITEDLITTILYRPFDIRYTYFTGKANGFHGRPKTISKSLFKQKNLALISARTNKTGIMDHFLISSTLTEAKCAESSTQSYIFPLKFLYDSNLIDNINPNFKKALEVNLQIEKDNLQANNDIISPENIFAYIYAIVYSDSYRNTFKSFMAYDFPKIPIISNIDLFKNLVNIGNKLISYHLMNFYFVDNNKINFLLLSHGTIKNVSFKDSRIYINKDDYFSTVDQSIFNYTIGNYKILKKWLLGRKNRKLSQREINDFKKIVFSLEETQKLVNEINNILPAFDKF